MPEFCSSFSILFVSLSEDVEFVRPPLCRPVLGPADPAIKLLSVHDDTEGGNKQEEGHDPKCQGGGGGGRGGGGFN